MMLLNTHQFILGNYILEYKMNGKIYKEYILKLKDLI